MDANSFGESHSPSALIGEFQVDVQTLQTRLEYLEKREQELMEVNDKNEQEFGIKRAQFQMIYIQKEAECLQMKDECRKFNEKSGEYEVKAQQQINMYEEMRAVAEITERTKKEEIDAIHCRHQEEVASLQHIMTVAVQDAINATVQKYEDAHQTLRRKYAELEAELQDLRNKLPSDKDNAVSTLTKGLPKKRDTSGAGENLEDSMKKAQEDTELLKSVVIPLEEEIRALKGKLRQSAAQVDALEKERESLRKVSSSPTRSLASRNLLLDLDEHSVSDLDTTAPQDLIFLGEEKEWTQWVGAEQDSISLGRGAAMEEVVTERDRLREEVKKLNEEKTNNAHELQKLKDRLSEEESGRRQLDTTLTELSKQMADKTETVQVQYGEMKKHFDALESHCFDVQQNLGEQIRMVIRDRDLIQKELERLQQDNERLSGKYMKHSRQLQAEGFDLPQNMEDLQIHVLQARENVIIARTAQEYSDERLKSEILFLKEQLEGEQLEKRNLEDSLSREIQQLQEQKIVEESVQSELVRERKVRHEAENNLRTAQAQLKQRLDEYQNLVGALQQHSEELQKGKQTVDEENHKLRQKVHSLRADLETSEAVQKDFVKLSQSLQIELEKIRSSESEVRWQHEDDFDHCANCNVSFSVTKRKHHCRHCGKVFCADCTLKTVNSGPNMRPARVCDVCHTLLVHDAKPYFSSQAPSRPT